MTSIEAVQICLLCYLAAVITQSVRDVTTTLQHGLFYELLFHLSIIGVVSVFWAWQKSLEHRDVARKSAQRHYSARLQLPNDVLEEVSKITISNHQTKIDIYLSDQKPTRGNTEHKKQEDPQKTEKQQGCFPVDQVKDQGVYDLNHHDQIKTATYNKSGFDSNGITANAPKFAFSDPKADTISGLASVEKNIRVDADGKGETRDCRNKSKNLQNFTIPEVIGTHKDSAGDQGTAYAVPTPDGFEEDVRHMSNRMPKPAMWW